MGLLNYLVNSLTSKIILFILLFPLIAVAEIHLPDDAYVGNLNFLANTVSSTDTNGDIILDPNGTGGVLLNDLTANTVLYLDVNKEATSSSVTDTELGYLSGVTSAVQTQLGVKLDDLTSTTDNALVRTDGTTGEAIQDSSVTLDDSDVMSGITQLNVDNLRLDGNTLSSTDTNGDVSITPDGTGTVLLPEVNVLAEGELRLQDATGGEYMGFKAPTTLTASETLTLPDGDGSAGQAMVTDGSGVLSWGNAGGGSGGKNYFTDGDLESNITLATAYDDGGAYVDGDGGSPATISVSQNTTNPLRDGKDLKITKAATDGSGEGVTLLSDTITSADQGKTFFFSAQSDFSHASYTAGDICIKAYDVAGTAELYVEPIGGLDDNGCFEASKGAVLAKVLTTSSTTGAVRLSLHLASDSATASSWDAYVDDAILGPDATVPGAIITESRSFTPTGTWFSGNETYSGKWRRVGDHAEILYSIDITGAVTAAALAVDLPPGLAVDESKLSFTVAGLAGAFGSGEAADLSTSSSYAVDGFVQQGSDRILLRSTSTAASAFANVANNVPFVFASGDSITVKVSVPIEGWSSGAMLSTTEAGLQTLSAKLYLGTNQNIASTSSTVVQLDTVAFDTHNILDTANYKAVIPRDGRYLLNFHIRADNYTNAEFFRGAILKNGSVNLTQDSDPGASGTAQVSSVVIADLVAGDELTITADSSADANYDVQSGSDRTYLEVTRLPDFTIFSIYGNTDYVEATAGLASYPITANQWGDIDVISLPKGTWDISAHAIFKSNGGATTTTEIDIGIGTVSGNVSPGANGDVVIIGTKNTAVNSYDSLTLAPKEFILNSGGTVYLKGFAGTSTANLQIAYRISARKVK